MPPTDHACAKTSPDAAATALVSCRAVRKVYETGRNLGGRKHRKLTITALDGVDLDIGHNEVLALVGESGCGKSTLGRCLAGVERPTSGRVSFDGIDVSRGLPVADRRRIQMVFQDPRGSFDPRMTMEASLSEPFALARVGTRSDRLQRARELLESVQTSESFLSRYPHELSGGELQRIAIARAVALHPDFLVADEPVSALDPSIRARIVDLLESLHRRLGAAMLIILHDVALATRIGRRMAVMYLGRIVEIGPSDVLAGDPRHPYTRALVAASRSFDEARALIHGEPDSAAEIPSGCRFRRRCPVAFDLCERAEPELRTVGPAPGRLAACHRADETR